MKIESKAECEIDTFDGIFAFNSSSFNEEILIGIYKQIIENKGKIKEVYYDNLKSTETKKEN